MRIRLWNAFASNNSGSYTIVGRFEDAARAAEVEAELAEVIAAHTAWHDAHAWDDSEGSPLVAFAAARGLAVSPKLGSGDAWPEHGSPPEVIAIGPQVVVHAPYTVTLPRTFGELFYARGGVVETCLDHAHHPLVVHVEVYWPWSWEEEVRRTRADGLEAAILAEDNAVWPHVAGQEPWKPPTPKARLPLVCVHGDGMEASLTVVAVFGDLVAGVRELVTLVTAHDATYRVRIVEALDHDNPLAHVRGERNVQRVTVDKVGASRKAVVELVARHLGVPVKEAWDRLKASPADLGELRQEIAIALAEELRAAGARVTLGAARVELVPR